MNMKKLPRELVILLLTLGASSILGFLSFSGMLALTPVLPLAFLAFVLSVAYEGEIYLQNIKGALNKLFKNDYVPRQAAKDFLLKHFPDTKAKDCPQFFKDYEQQLTLWHALAHNPLNKDGKLAKERIAKTLSHMEKLFALELGMASTDKHGSKNHRELQQWLEDNGKTIWQMKLSEQQRKLPALKTFSMLAGAFMGLGTTYLLVEAFSAIPLFAAVSFATWPLIILPMAAIAGTAYGLLTYNAITDFITNDTMRKWWGKIKKSFEKDGLTPRNVFLVATSAVLVSLAIALTICTAGTWWTVAKETRPLFAWMGRMPSIVMGVINPIITGLSAVVFNLQNSSETLKIINKGIKKHTHAPDEKKDKGSKSKENILQLLNPFRLLLKITITPLRLLLFVGHLVSIGVTSDRVPGISQVLSAILGIISEGFEDAHYFFGHHHHEKTQEAILKERLGEGHGHNHENDLPTRLLKSAFAPIYFLAASWDYLGSLRNNTPLDFTAAWRKQTGQKAEKPIVLADNPAPSTLVWEKEYEIYRGPRVKGKNHSRFFSPSIQKTPNAPSGLDEMNPLLSHNKGLNRLY